MSFSPFPLILLVVFYGSMVSPGRFLIPLGFEPCKKRSYLFFLPQKGSITIGTAKFFPSLLFSALRVMDGGAVQAVVTPPAPSCPLYDDEVQGKFCGGFSCGFFMVPPSVNLSFLPGFSNPNLYCLRHPTQSIRARSFETLDG